MRKQLISGDGGKQWASVIVNVIVAFSCLGAGFYFMFSLADKMRGNEKSAYTTIGVVLIIMGVFRVIPILKASFIARTKIAVYEDGLEADALEKGPFQMQNIKLSFDQIVNVDVVKNTAVVIHTSYTQYKCFASNAAEIRDVIFERIKR